MAGDLRLTGKCYIHYNCNSVDATLLEDVSQLCTFVSDYYKRDSSGNDFLFRVSATGSSRDVSWIHTYRMGQIPG